MRHCRVSIDEVSAGTGTSGTGCSRRRKKKNNRRRNALQSEVRSTGARREKRRKLQAPKARGESWLATAVPCCLWAGEEEERGGKSVGEVFFFFSFFFPLPPPHRHGKASGQKLPVQKPSLPRGTLKAWRIPGLGTEWPLVPGQAWPITVCHCRSPETQHGRCWIIRCIRLNPARITCLLIAGS